MCKTLQYLLALLLISTFGSVRGDENISSSENGVSDNEIYFPVGLKWRTFTISPLFELENEYEDNIFKTTINKKDDFIFHLKPSLNIRSNWSRHALDLTVRADFSLYQRYEQEDTDDIYIDLSGRIDVLRDSYATTKFYWSQSHEERGDVDNGGIDGPTQAITIGGIAEYEHQFNWLRLNVSNDITYIDFQDEMSLFDGEEEPVNDNLRNHFANTSIAQLAYEINPALDVFIRGQYNFRDYDSKVDRNGFNRDSDGFEINVGSGFDITGKLFGDMYIGYREQYFVEPDFKDITGLTGGASLSWSATALTSVSLAVDNDIIETTQEGASSGISTAFKLNVDHELLRYLLLNAHGGYTINEYQGSPGIGSASREDQTIILGVKAKYTYSNNFYLKGEYIYSERLSNIPLNDYQAHRVLLSIGLQI